MVGTARRVDNQVSNHKEGFIKMDLDKPYHDADFNKMNILELVKKEPEWAAEKIQDYEKRLMELTNET